MWKRPEIRFQQASEDTFGTESAPKHDRGEAVASFYRSVTSALPVPSPPEVIIIDSPPPSSVEELCPTCHLPLPLAPRLRRKHYSTTAHLSKVVDTRPPPVTPLPIDRSSIGYKVLLSQGWSDKERHGIGAEDNKGRREPVKATRVKNDTVGLGIKAKKVQETVKEKKLIESGKDIRKAYQREKQIRKDLLAYMNS
jgi:hypothetical protein